MSVCVFGVCLWRVKINREVPILYLRGGTKYFKKVTQPEIARIDKASNTSDKARSQAHREFHSMINPQKVPLVAKA